jgi:hypothetical protein
MLTKAKQRKFRPSVEILEDRTALSDYGWTGATN